MSKDTINIDDWVASRRSASRRSGSVLISLISDFVVPHGGAIALGSLVDAGACVGVSEHTIRSSVNRLVADGWVSTESMGRRSICRFSDSGMKRYSMAAKRIYQNLNTDWSGEWHMIVSNNWMIEPERYSEHVRDILWSGFGRVSENVFIRPKLAQKGSCCNWDLPEALPESLACFTGIKKQCIPDTAINAMIQRAWDLGTVKSRYQFFIDRYEGLLDTLLKSPAVSGVQAFSIRSLMFHDFRRIRLIDPVLPAALHSPKWNGDHAFSIAQRLYQLLAHPSEQYIMEVMQGPEGRLPRAKAWFFDRFGGLAKV